MLEGKRIAIWGMGVEGNAVLQLLSSYKPIIIENNIIPDDVDVVIKSPGVSNYLPQISDAKNRGVIFTSLMNIFLERLHTQKKSPKVIAITGTKGKSTTASMLAFMLEKLGYRVGLGGNIGKTPLDFLGVDLDFIILELSSFQITDLVESVDVGVVLNISKAHLDWHLGFENYVNDKLRLVKLADKVVVNKSILLSLPLRERIGVRGSTTSDPTQPPLERGGVIRYDSPEGFHVKEGKVFDKGIELELPTLKIFGDHNLSNLCADLTVLKMLGVDYKKAISYLGEFQGLDHRLQKVHEKSGLVFIDDSIATVPESVEAAILSFKGQDVALIIGGYNNGSADYEKLNQRIENSPWVKTVLCLPETGALVKTSKSIVVKTMQEAVAKAIEIGKGVVLLSPAAPSFNMYKNYKERGDDFARIAKELK